MFLMHSYTSQYPMSRSVKLSAAAMAMQLPDYHQSVRMHIVAACLHFILLSFIKIWPLHCAYALLKESCMVVLL